MSERDEEVDDGGHACVVVGNEITRPSIGDPVDEDRWQLGT